MSSSGTITQPSGPSVPVIPRFRGSCAVAALILLLAITSFTIIATTRLYLPGLYYDELIWIGAAFRILGDCSVQAMVSLSLDCYPLYLWPPYLGALKSWVYAPIFAIWPVTAESIRLPMVILVGSTLIGFYQFWSRRLGHVIAGCLVLLVASDPAIIFQTRVDWGPFAISFALRVISVCAMISFGESGKIRSFCLAMAALVLGVYDKLNFFWTVAGVSIATLLVYPKALVDGFRAHKMVLSCCSALAAFSLGILVIAFLIPALRLGLHDPSLALTHQISKVYDLIVSAITASGQFAFMFGGVPNALRISPYLLPVQLAGGTVLAAFAIWHPSSFAPCRAVIVRAFIFVHVCILVIIASMIMTREVAGVHHAIAVVPLIDLDLVLGMITLFQTKGIRLSHRKLVIGVAPIIVVAVLAQHGSVAAAYLGRLDERQIGNPNFSPQIYDLSRRVNAIQDARFGTTDWGIVWPLVALAPRSTRDRFFDTYPWFSEPGDEPIERLAGRLFDQYRINVLIGRPLETAAFPRGAETLDRLVQFLGECVAEDLRIGHVNDQPAYRWVRVIPNCQVSAIPLNRFTSDRFDVNGEWTAPQSTEVLVGSYPIETANGKKFAWIGESAHITLQPKRPIIGLRVSGYLPVSAHRNRDGVSSVSLQVKLNGQDIGTITASQDGAFDHILKARTIQSIERGVVIELVPSNVLLPTSSDARQLSLIMTSVQLIY